MDTRLKNSKKLSFIAAAVIVAVFAAGFMSLYPVFEERASVYIKDTDVLQSDEFLRKIYQSNYIFYKDVAERIGKSNVSYADLYLDMQEEYIEKDTQTGNGDWYEEQGSLDSMVREEIEVRFKDWEEEVMYSIAQETDYCVIDKATGQMVKNTGRKIELLNEPKEQAAEELEALPYVYYIKMEFDSIGNMKNVAVKSQNSDELLKSVQRVMKSRMAENNLSYIKSYYSYVEAYDSMMKKITYGLNAPKDVTFIYALTKEQQSNLVSSGEIVDTWWIEGGAYWQAGVVRVYIAMLIALAVLLFLLFHFQWYKLYMDKKINPHLEFVIIAGIFIMVVMGESMVDLVYNTNEGLFNTEYMRYLPFLSQEVYPLLTGTVNFAYLFFAFGAWFYCVNALGETVTLGIGGYLRERSLCVRLWVRSKKFCNKYIMAFKEEVLHVNLSEETGKTIRKAVLVNFFILAGICSIWFFGWMVLIVYSIVLYFILKKFVGNIQNQYRKLLEATGSIAEGNLHTDFDEDLGIFESYKEQLYRIQEGFRKAVDEEVKSQRMKAELITNVSHDLKTPLTAITTYIDLLKEEGITEKQREEYIQVLEKKSMRLKFLIEDLFEVSKANSRNITVSLVDVDICHLMRQAYLECEDKVEEADLLFRFRVPDEKIILQLDSQKTYRIFENIYNNIIKYAMPHTRVYVNAEKTEKGIRIEMKNMSANELNIDPKELTERFVRGDSSRNTEGNGLGLAIAQSFAELQGGRLEVGIDGDLFKVTLEWE